MPKRLTERCHANLSRAESWPKNSWVSVCARFQQVLTWRAGAAPVAAAGGQRRRSRAGPLTQQRRGSACAQKQTPTNALRCTEAAALCGSTPPRKRAGPPRLGAEKLLRKRGF